MAVQAGVFAALDGETRVFGTEKIFEGKEGLMECFGEGWAIEKMVGRTRRIV